MTQPEELERLAFCEPGSAGTGRPPDITVFGSVGSRPTCCVTSILRIQHNFQLVKAQDFPFLPGWSLVEGYHAAAVGGDGAWQVVGVYGPLVYVHGVF